MAEYTRSKPCPTDVRLTWLPAAEVLHYWQVVWPIAPVLPTMAWRRVYPLILCSNILYIWRWFILSRFFCWITNLAPSFLPASHHPYLALFLLVSSVHLLGEVWCFRARRALHSAQPHKHGLRCRARSLRFPTKFSFMHPCMITRFHWARIGNVCFVSRLPSTITLRVLSLQLLISQSFLIY